MKTWYVQKMRGQVLNSHCRHVLLSVPVYDACCRVVFQLSIWFFYLFFLVLPVLHYIWMMIWLVKMTMTNEKYLHVVYISHLLIADSVYRKQKQVPKKTKVNWIKDVVNTLKKNKLSDISNRYSVFALVFFKFIFQLPYTCDITLKSCIYIFFHKRTPSLLWIN